MERRTAALIVALLVSPGCFEEPPDAPRGDAGGEQLSAFDACVELLAASAAADCADACDAAWCHRETCSSRTEGEIVDACNGLELVGDAAVTRTALDACIADSCNIVMGVCSLGAGPRCSDACNDLGIFEACIASEECCASACADPEFCEVAEGYTTD